LGFVIRGRKSRNPGDNNPVAANMSLFDVTAMHARVLVKGTLKRCAAAASVLTPARAGGPSTVVSLMYHRVNSYRRNELSVDPVAFRSQIQWLADNGFHNLRISDIESGFAVQPGGSDRFVVLTFDDGYEDNYSIARPILLEFGYTAMFYIPTSFIGSDRLAARDVRESNRPERNRRMTWEQVRSLAADGMEIGSHTMSHERLTGLDTEQARREIVESKSILETELAARVTSFCYPGGSYTRDHVNMVRQSGYQSACTAAPGSPADLGTDLLELPRLAVNRSDSLFVFKQKLNGRLDWFTAVR